MRAARIRVIEDHADIAPVGIAAGEAHARTQRIGERNAQGEQQRPRPVIAAGGVTLLELHAQQRLRQIVAPRGKLVEHLLGRDEFFLLDPVHLAAGEDDPRDLAPIDLGGHQAGVALSH